MASVEGQRQVAPSDIRQAPPFGAEQVEQRAHVLDALLDPVGLGVSRGVAEGVAAHVPRHYPALGAQGLDVASHIRLLAEKPWVRSSGGPLVAVPWTS